MHADANGAGKPKNGTVVRLHGKDIIIVLGLLTILWGAITFVFGFMYFPRDEGIALASDFGHHVEAVKTKETTQDKALEDGEDERDSMRGILIRMETRQDMMAPPRVKRAVPLPDREDL